MNPKALEPRTDKLKAMISRWLNTRERQVAAWLRQGISPQRLALTLALGFAIGCLPVVGIPTALCLMLALTLRLNLPAIQVANYVAMPLQVLLILPFVRLGGWLFAPGHSRRAMLDAWFGGANAVEFRKPGGACAGGMAGDCRAGGAS